MTTGVQASARGEPESPLAVDAPMPSSMAVEQWALNERQRRFLVAIGGVLVLLAAFVVWPRRKWQDNRVVFPPSPPTARLTLRDPLLHPELVVPMALAGSRGASATKWVTVDSGATGVLLPEPYYESLGLELLTGVTVRTEDLRGHVYVRPAGLIPQLDMGALTVKDVVVAVGGHTPVLGQAVLAHSPWEVDWDTGLLTLGAGAPPTGATVVPLRRHGDAEVVTMWVEGQPVDMVVDTGAAVSILPEMMVTQSGLAAQYTPGPVVFRSVAGEFVVRKYFEGNARLGDLELGRLRFAAIKTGGRRGGLGLLGLDVLSRFRVHVTPRSQLALLPRRDLRETARQRTSRWAFLPSCRHEGCMTARLEPIGEDAKLELGFEADLKAPVEVLLGCRVDPEDVAVVNSLGLDFSSDHSGARHIRVRISATTAGKAASTVIHAGGRWFEDGGRQCEELIALDVVPMGTDPIGAGPQEGSTTAHEGELQASMWW